MQLKIEYVPTNDVKTYENNAKIHTAEQIEQIKNSITQFGFNDPIAVWKDNVIIEGHGRLIAAKELGLEEVPIIRLDELTDKQRRAYIIAHNKLTMNTGFDNDILGTELQDIIGDIDMTQLGFGEFELTILTEDIEPEPYDNDIIDKYSGNEESFLAKKRGIITYTDETEERLKKILGVDEIKKVVYEVTEIGNV